MDEIKVKLLVPEALKAGDEATTAENLVDSLGRPFRFRFTCVGEIPTGPGGKLEDLISKLPNG